MKEIQKRFDSKEVADIVLECDTILHSNGYTTKIKPNRIEFFQKVKIVGEFTPLIALIKGISEGVLIFKKESGILKIKIKQKLLLHGFVTILVFAMLSFILTLIEDKGLEIKLILITGLIIIPLSLIGMIKNINRTRRVYKLLDELL